MAGTSPDSLEPSIEAPTDYLAPPLDRCRLAPVRVASRYGPLSKLIGCNREIDAWIPTSGISEHSVTLSLIRRSHLIREQTGEDLTGSGRQFVVEEASLEVAFEHKLEGVTLLRVGRGP